VIIILKIIDVPSHSIHPLTKEVAFEVASNLRYEDYREITEGHGIDPVPFLTDDVHKGYQISIQAPNGKTAGIGGVQDQGVIWLLTTPVIYDYPVSFARVCKQLIKEQQELNPILWNIVDKRNVEHLKLLKFLGFKFIREIKHGPHKLSFIEFCRVHRFKSK